ncbi:MAG TPA: hypothetical protein VK780_09115 [Thermoanaerobaculia bacterium]|jgi:hypothetical protein|nr:hypothetical protein [Thermoanaerobaculia bacterium]
MRKGAMDQGNRPTDSVDPNRGGDPARSIGPRPSDGVGLEAEALSPDERRTLASLQSIMAKEKFLKGRRHARRD